MTAEFKNFGPYYRNGKLFLPEGTVSALVSAGLDQSTADKVLRGVALDDHQSLHILSQAIRNLLRMFEIDHPIASALASEDTRFALTGLPQQL